MERWRRFWKARRAGANAKFLYGVIGFFDERRFGGAALPPGRRLKASTESTTLAAAEVAGSSRQLM
jgi:hypothetical protein